METCENIPLSRTKSNPRSKDLTPCCQSSAMTAEEATSTQGQLTQAEDGGGVGCCTALDVFAFTS